MKWKKKLEEEKRREKIQTAENIKTESSIEKREKKNEQQNGNIFRRDKQKKHNFTQTSPSFPITA